VATEFLLLWKSKLAIGSAGGNDYGLGLKFLSTTGLNLLDITLEINLDHIVEEDFSSKSLCLGLEISH